MMDLSNLLPAIENACGLRALRERLDTSREPLVLGVSGAAKGAVIAGLARSSDARLLVVVPRPPQALALAEEVAAWLGDALPLLPFPERDALPYERLLPDPDALRDRLRALQAFHEGRPCVVVASGIALAQRTLPSDALDGASVELQVGGRTTPDALLASLLRLGYRTASLVQLPGEAARRGGIVDIFPATDDAPVRIELLGDQVESLRRFDAESQRSLGLLDAIAIGPAREVIDLPKAIEALSGQLDLSRCQPEARERFKEELARLQAGDSIPEEAFYVPFLASGCLIDHLPADAMLVVDEPADLAQALEEHDAQSEEVRQELTAQGQLPPGFPIPHASWDELRAALDRLPRRLHLSRWAVDEPRPEAQPEGRTEETAGAPADESGATRLPFVPAGAYGGRLRNLAADAAESAAHGRALVIVSQQAERLAEVLTEQGVATALTPQPAAPRPGLITIVHGSLPHGWRLTTSAPPLTLLTDAEVFGFVKQRRRTPRRAGGSREAFLAELTPGDYVVHIEHGIARFAGLVRRKQGEGTEREYLDLRYAQGDRLYLPAEQVDRVSRYVGPGDQTPSLTRLGSQEWSRAKERVRRAVAELARELLELYAARELEKGRAFSSDTPWQQELEASFPYVETPDQVAAVREVKRDMERPRPMDRLVCGDVGYGKTEVALR